MSDSLRTELQFTATDRSGKVAAVLLRPPEACWLLVLAHGAGAGMHHPFMHACPSTIGDAFLKAQSGNLESPETVERLCRPMC